MNVGALNSKSAEVNGTKPKSLRTGREMPHRQKKSRARMQSLLGLQFVYMGVFSDDFATVDVREELCYHSRPKKHKFRGLKEVFIQSGLSCRRNRGQKIIRTLTWCLGSYYSGMVRRTGLEPVWLPTRPSNVRVCQFRHPRADDLTIILNMQMFVNRFFSKKMQFYAV